jgi:cytoskeletal protein CcmA (bactofilin family)
MFGFKKNADDTLGGKSFDSGADDGQHGASNIHLRDSSNLPFLSKPMPLDNGVATTSPTFRPEIPRRVFPEIPAIAKALNLTPPAKVDHEAKMLLVGREITLSGGQISACEKLVVEGRVEAVLEACRVIEIAETGSFKGSADIEEAEIRGRLDGKLSVRGKLVVRSTGRVSGEIRYGQIEIEAGGEISGNVQASSEFAKSPAPGDEVAD